MHRPPPQTISDTTVLTTWRDHLATTAQTPRPVWEPVQAGSALRQRFTAWYAQLRALPRRTRRTLQRKLALPLAGVALLLALGPGPSLAATLVVDGATCTLVDAITAANWDTAQGGCPAGSGADTLVLEPPGSTVTLTHAYDYLYGPTGLPVISSAITIAGQGGTIMRASSAPPFRLVAVNDSGNLTLQEVTLIGGMASRDWKFGTLGGGGVLNRDGTVTIDQCTIARNTGGGVLNRDGTLTINQSTITANTGDGVVNAAYDDSAILTVTQSTITGNSARGVHNESSYDSVADVKISQSLISDNYGGGVRNSACRDWYCDSSATVALTQSTISGNTASAGGGVLNVLGSVTLTRSTIAGNTASSHGGGVLNYFYGSVTLTQSTITGNTATDDGGGILNDSGSVMLTQSTISGNAASAGGGAVNQGTYIINRYGYYHGYGRLTVIQSTIAGNTATGHGGGVLNRANWSASASLMLTSSTISRNTAATGGGMVNTPNGDDSLVTATLLQDTITGNTATDAGGGVVNTDAHDFSNTTLTLTLAGSLITGNLAPTAPEIEGSQGDVRADAFNLFGFSGTAGVTGFTPGRTDLVPAVPLTAILDPVLADHGGPTLTHALVPGSPALDAIPRGTHGCGTTNYSDQRGTARPQPAGGPCDIGAYEVEAAGQPLGAWVVGLAPGTVVCKNVTTAQAVTISEPATAWDCEAAGLGVSTGDHVAMRVRGTVAAGAPDVGGAVTGVAPGSASCTNLTSGQQVRFRMMRDATAGSCVAAGLVVSPGDRLQMRVQGLAE